MIAIDITLIYSSVLTYPFYFMCVDPEFIFPVERI